MATSSTTFRVGHTTPLEVREKISASLKGRALSEETKLKMLGRTPWNKGKKRPEISGKNHPRWKGGITPENNRIRSSLEYANWRREVFGRDQHTCTFCGARNGEGKTVVLNADHIKPFATYPELRFDVSNGRTLCFPCHVTTPNYGGRL